MTEKKTNKRKEITLCIYFFGKFRSREVMASAVVVNENEGRKLKH